MLEVKKCITLSKIILGQTCSDRLSTNLYLQHIFSLTNLVIHSIKILVRNFLTYTIRLDL